ncbi:MAG: N-acetyl-alpha-D-glucosaminyl L-malate synthase BshA [Oligoflexia bacterium]|nr:N-acetyl-alpha-D-glucosaminyl L-malate synthase BshA [Oligoflexia bacterium]
MTDRKLRIGITCYPTYGGSGVIATEIGMGMAKRGHRVHFICSDVPRRLDRFTENIFFHEVETHEYPLFPFPHYDLALASKMVEVATYEKLDLLHVHYAVPHATSAYLARQILGRGAPKIITTLHGTDITLVGHERGYLPITRFSITQSTAVTAPSMFLKHATYDKLNVPTDFPIEVIPNFVDTSVFKPIEGPSQKFLKHCAACKEKEPVLTHISNFRPVKRVEDVVRVFEIVQREIPCGLVFVGDGPTRYNAEALVRELGLEQRVCFLGKQESIAEVLQGSTVFLLPSKNESFGLAALEAMSCGVPVVASKAEGLPEVVLHGETGFLSEVGDVSDMAANVLRLLREPALYRKLSHAGRKLAVEKYEFEKLMTRYEEYYFQVLGL